MLHPSTIGSIARADALGIALGVSLGIGATDARAFDETRTDQAPPDLRYFTQSKQ